MAEIFNSSIDPSKKSRSLFSSNNLSPRSCTNPNIFNDILPPSYYPVDNRDEADGINCLRNVSYEDVTDEETPAEVAMLLTSVADIATKEINADPPVMSALADAFPRFREVTQALSNKNDRHRQGEDYEDMKIDSEHHPNEPSTPSLMHFDHKKTRAVSMDTPELRVRKVPLAATSPPPLYQTDTIPALLQWRDLRGKSTSPPYLQGIFSTPPPSPIPSSSKPSVHRMTPNINSSRSNLHLPAKSQHVRPRSISLADAAMKHLPDLDLTAPESASFENLTALDSGVGKMPKEVILRKKFSWKNYPEVSVIILSCVIAIDSCIKSHLTSNP